MDFLADDIRLAPELLEAWKRGDTRISVLIESARSGCTESHNRLLQLATYFHKSSKPFPEGLTEYVAQFLEQEAFGDAAKKLPGHGGRPENKERDIEIAFKVKEKINHGLSLNKASEAVKAENLRYSVSDQRIRQIYRDHETFLRDYFEAQPARQAEAKQQMRAAIDCEYLKLMPPPMREALDLINDLSKAALPETPKLLMKLEKETLAELIAENVKSGISDDTYPAFLTKLYWHGYKYVDDEGKEREVVSCMHPPLWNRFYSALKQMTVNQI